MLTEHQEQRGTLDVELAQKNMAHCKILRERVQQENTTSISTTSGSECITITYGPDSEGPAKVETMTPEQMAASGAATDWNAVGEQVAALQTRIDEIGPVNLVAIEEYEETEQRHTFLSTQHDDLVSAKTPSCSKSSTSHPNPGKPAPDVHGDLRENPRRTSATCSTEEVFGGGKADLILVGEGDALESGIDIVARLARYIKAITDHFRCWLRRRTDHDRRLAAVLHLPGQAQPVLRAGRVGRAAGSRKPSNINRFIKVLQRFLAGIRNSSSMLTHSKRTIGMADVLYGVTMEEHRHQQVLSAASSSIKRTEVVTDHLRAESRWFLRQPMIPRWRSAEDTPHKPDETVDIAMAK